MTDTKENLIIDAAHAVFLRYGFKRVTMGDIAEAAGISRPAVYLLFPNKEAVFKAVVRKLNRHSLEKIQAGVALHASVAKQLLFAFDVWAVQPAEAIMQSPESRELVNSAYELAGDVVEESGLIFESLLMEIVKPALKNKKNQSMSVKQVAHLMRGAARGFKEVAKNTDELRGMIKQFIELILKGLSIE